jgi:hypothetical protein
MRELQVGHISAVKRAMLQALATVSLSASAPRSEVLALPLCVPK